MKNLNGKYFQTLLDHAKQSATDTVKSISKRVIQKAVEATSDLICNKNVDKVTKVSRSSWPIIVQEQLQMKKEILDFIEIYQNICLYIFQK